MLERAQKELSPRVPIIRNWEKLDAEGVAIQEKPLSQFVVVASFGDETVTVSPIGAKSSGQAMARAIALLASRDWWPSPRAFRLHAFLDHRGL